MTSSKGGGSSGASTGGDTDDATDDATHDATDDDTSLVKGLDYTIDPETGFLVFTREYLLKRGTCCQTGCRNCPYGFKKT